MRSPPRLLVLTLSALAGLAACTDDAGADDEASSSKGDDNGDGDGNGGQPCGDAPSFSGEATYYAADGSGNCSFPASPEDLMVGAMNASDYANSAACGSCVAIQGPAGAVEVRIVDQCPECSPGDIDLSPEAFAKIAALEAGRVDIEWSYVPCPVDGPVRYHFKEGSHQWWTGVQVRNHRHAIETFEVLMDGAWVEVPRLSYNYFVRDSGMGPGPYTFRTTDVTGAILEDSGVPLLDDASASGQGQFPACAP